MSDKSMHIFHRIFQASLQNRKMSLIISERFRPESQKML